MQRIDRDELQERARRSLSAIPRPFARWAGSKRTLLPEIVKLLPAEFRDYREPFVGGGSLFFLLQPVSAVLSDSCGELIDAYRALRDDPERLIRILEPLRPEREFFYQLRSNRSSDPIIRAAEFIYLNKTCWNGLYRVNSNGHFNVPYGLPKTDSLFDADNLRACGRVLSGAEIEILHGDFEELLVDTAEADLVFLDPPYVTRHNNNGFVDYNETLFSWKDQERLARVAGTMADRGATVIVANANHQEMIELYRSFRTVTVSRSSTLAGKVASRGRVEEALLVSPSS